MLVPTPTDLMPADRRAGVSLWYVATRAGIAGKTEQWVLNWVREMHANEHFPAPLPYVQLSNGKRKDHIHLQSRWLRDAVDAWFHGFLPPHLITVAGELDQRRDAELLDARAADLAAVLGAVR